MYNTIRWVYWGIFWRVYSTKREFIYLSTHHCNASWGPRNFPFVSTFFPEESFIYLFISLKHNHSILLHLNRGGSHKQKVAHQSWLSILLKPLFAIVAPWIILVGCHLISSEKHNYHLLRSTSHQLIKRCTELCDGFTCPIKFIHWL